VDRVSEQDDDWNDENDALGDETTLSEDEEEDLDLISDETPESLPARGEGRRKRRRRRRKRSQNAGGAEMGEPHSEPVRDDRISGQHESFDRPEPQRVVAPAPREREQRQDLQRQESSRAETRRGDSGGSGGELQAPKSDGKLVGWFVTFGENAQGESTEIRAGRFFLGRQKLRGNDYIIPHSSISTPHCMIVAGGGDALMIQDLMSEGGTQLKRAGESTYSPVTNAVSVHHGDWVRFGQYEAMVCLLPKGRAS
jgi:hypothetical protein